MRSRLMVRMFDACVNDTPAIATESITNEVLTAFRLMDCSAVSTRNVITSTPVKDFGYGLRKQL